MPNAPDNNVLTTDDLRIDAAWWVQLQELYHLLESTPVDRQSAVLDRATTDPLLRTRVLSLLATSAESGAPSPAAPAANGQAPVVAGTRIGPYAVLRHLGSGGLGSVYLTQRMIGGALQHCALKLLTLRSTEPSFRARFEREEQILATLQHPNITHLFDAGITDLGQPYLVMEFVDGVDLTRYCEQHRLPIHRRLEIFLNICDAVRYAHSQLVVHLDLKPSNVLVTAAGTVKLLDFGTSKLIDLDATMTTTVLATPAYASPEQLRGAPVTTSCDLYSLGVILYELLAGHRPFASLSAASAAHRAVTEEEPPPLYANLSLEAAEARGVPLERLRRMLQGDLSSIVARCLRSRPRGRYSSVEALAEDLKRFLAGRPVLARPQTAAYRAGKFLRRNRTLVTVSSGALLAIAGSMTYAVVREHEAIRNEQRALQMQTFLYRLLYVANANYMGKPTFRVPDFLDLGARLLPNYVTNAADLRRAQLGLADSMFENDDTDGAAKVYADVIRSALAANDVNSEIEAEATGGYIAYEKGNVAQGEAMTAHAFELSRHRDTTATARVWSGVYYAILRDESGSRTEANLQLLERAAAEAVSAPLPQREIADVDYNLALAYQARARYKDSETAYGKALRIYDQDPEAQCDRSDIRRGMATDEEGLGNDAESLSQFEMAWAESRQCSGESSQNSLNNATYVAETLLRLGRAGEARSILQQVLPALKKNGLDGLRLRRPTRLMGQAYVDCGDFASAATLFRDFAAHTAIDASGRSDPESGLFELVWAQASLGLGSKADALTHAREAQRRLTVDQATPAQKRGAVQATALVDKLAP